jgi:hypothetical protein
MPPPGAPPTAAGGGPSGNAVLNVPLNRIANTFFRPLAVNSFNDSVRKLSAVAKSIPLLCSELSNKISAVGPPAAGAENAPAETIVIDCKLSVIGLERLIAPAGNCNAVGF